MENRPDCSWKPSAWCERADHVGLLLRIALTCELEALTGCSLSWKRSATPAGRSWWVLTTLARPTSESECGLFVATPLSQQGRMRAKSNGKRGADLNSMLLPLARDAIQGGNSRPLLERKGIAGMAVLSGIYGWLMGYPPGWLESVLPPMEMPSSLRSRSSSAGRS